MDLELKDQPILIAGSSRGIGRAIAQRFLQEGARVLISGRDADSVHATVNELSGKFAAESIASFVGDLTDDNATRDCLHRFEARWGTPTAVVANVGSGRSVAGWHVDAAEYQRVFHLNFLASVGLVDAVLPSLLKKKSGSIVLIGSIAGVESTAAPLAYAAAKSALSSYGKNLARQVAPHGIRVNTVAPGNILFPGGSWAARQEEKPDDVRAYINSEVPMQRFGRPEEIADFVVFLSSSRASFASGMCAVLDGAQTRTV